MYRPEKISIRKVPMQREDLIQSMFAPPDAPPVRWRIAPSLVDYPEAVETMEREAAAIADGTADELVWLVEHPPLYTREPAPTPPTS